MGLKKTDHRELKVWWIEKMRVLAGPTPFPLEVSDPTLISSLRHLGVTMVINLQEKRWECPTDKYNSAVKKFWKTDLPSIHQFSTPDGTPPSAADMATILDLLRTSAGLAYVHCYAGRGRTGTVAGCWYREQGLGPSEAIDLVLERRSVVADGFRAPDNESQLEMIKSWCRRAK